MQKQGIGVKLTLTIWTIVIVLQVQTFDWKLHAKAVPGGWQVILGFLGLAVVNQRKATFEQSAAALRVAQQKIEDARRVSSNLNRSQGWGRGKTIDGPSSPKR